MPLIEFQNQKVVELADGASRVLIAPRFGARLLSWTCDDESIIHWPQNADWSSLHSIAHTRGGNPILFPFIARHFVDGELGKWRDENGVVREMPLHGFAREMPFEIIEQEAQVLRMRLVANDQTRAMYPFDFIFDVVYRLHGSTLETTFETSNTGDTPLPYYAGHHFYFAIPHNERARWQLEIPCARWGRQNPDGSPRFEPATNTLTALDAPELVDRFHLDFSKPRVLARRDDGRTILIEWDEEQSPLWHCVTTWTLSPESDFYCIEPWLGLPDAIHHGHGVRWLQPGQKETATCRVATYPDISP